MTIGLCEAQWFAATLVVTAVLINLNVLGIYTVFINTKNKFARFILTAILLLVTVIVFCAMGGSFVY